jgi:hypothetical protein
VRPPAAVVVLGFGFDGAPIAAVVVLVATNLPLVAPAGPARIGATVLQPQVESL